MHGAAVVHGADGESPTPPEGVVASGRRSLEAGAERDLRVASDTNSFPVADVHDPDTLHALISGSDGSLIYTSDASRLLAGPWIH